MKYSNHNRPLHPNLNYFQGSPYRQYGSGIGAAIKAGFKGFVIPMVKRYGIPVAKSFLQQAAPEVLNILDGSTKPKAAMKNAVKKTIRKQIGGGRRRRATAPLSQKKKRKTKSKKQFKSKSKQGRRNKSKIIKRKSLTPSFKKKTVGQGRQRKNKSKSRSRKDFFASIVDRA